MKFKFCLVLFILFGLNTVLAQNYIIYDVKPNDTPQSIAQANDVSLDQLYRYNPDLKNTQALSQQKIVIPKTESKNFGFLRYRVKNLETLYSISKSFNLSIADIKAFNPKLYDRELKAGEILKLPAYKLPKKYQNVDFNQSIKNSNFSAFKHIVLPGENKADIASKYGMSLRAFDSLNQNMIDVQSGQLVKVIPRYQNTDKQSSDLGILDMNLQYYEVPNRQTLYSLSKEFKISENIIFKLNPIVRREGLKAGMIIKLPQKLEVLNKQTQIVNLENYIQNFNEKKLALFLPFSLNRFDNDSVSKKNVLLRDELLNISLDMYQGVEMAIDKAKSKGIYTDLSVFDTKRDPQVIDSILSKNNLEDRDAIIGPILNKNVNQLSRSLNSKNIPIFLPFTKSENTQTTIINTLPDQSLKTETLITLIDSTKQNQNLIFITDSTSQSTFEKYKYSFPKATFFQLEKTYIESEELKNLLKPEQQNWIVLETKHKGVTESVVNSAYMYNKSFIEEETGNENEFDIKLFTSDRNQAYKEVLNNEALCKLKFTYISASKYDILETNNIIETYKTKYGYTPSRYVLRAFDLTYDILLRLAYEGSLKNEKGLNPYTEYSENRFAYSKSFMSDVYNNTALYIIQYLPDFEIKILNTDKSED
ncbi:PBP1 and LysM peptidoglycan-binding domain-containing protein [Mesohalobacter salilacus]|uniref:PBP1 and LysM peptidoglycan-binding domain-containing protein n=1 Tax=Mesohalobacter salilacus TaxID=2491711 RepID=UPI00268D3900